MYRGAPFRILRLRIHFTDFQKESLDVFLLKCSSAFAIPFSTDGYIRLDNFCLEINSGFSCLGAQIFYLQFVFSVVLDEMSSALAEFKGHILPDALFAQGKHPVVMHGSGIAVRFTACHYQFNTGQILLQIDGGDHGLADDVFMLYPKCCKNLQSFICPLLIFHGAADNHIVPAIAPIRGNTIHKPFDPLGQEKELAVLPLTNYIPAFHPPGIGILQQKVRGKADMRLPW